MGYISVLFYFYFTYSNNDHKGGNQRWIAVLNDEWSNSYETWGMTETNHRCSIDCFRFPIGYVGDWSGISRPNFALFRPRMGKISEMSEEFFIPRTNLLYAFYGDKCMIKKQQQNSELILLIMLTRTHVFYPVAIETVDTWHWRWNWSRRLENAPPASLARRRICFSSCAWHFNGETYEALSLWTPCEVWYSSDFQTSPW